ADWSEEKLSSLSPKTIELLESLRSNAGAVGKEGTPSQAVFAGDDTLVKTEGAYVGANMKFTSGNNKNQVRRVVDYNGETRTFTVAPPFPAVPAPGDTFALDRPPIRIEAYISPEVPEEYVQTRLNLLNLLREFEAASGGRVNVVIHDTIQLSPEAKTAEEQYGITPRQVRSSNRGSIRVDRIYLGVAIICGSERVKLPFVDRGVPVEYELVSAVTTVSQQKRKRLGLVKTDAQLTSSFDMTNFSQTPDEQVIVELRKQFEVVEIDFVPKDPNPTKDRELWAAELAGLDVLLAVQPSTLGPDQLDRFLAALRSGIPTAIFEDPLPTQFAVPGTADERRAPNQGGMMGMMNRQPPPPKGDVTKLWIMLNVLFSDDDVVYQEYNPLPSLGDLPRDWVFIAPASGRPEAFNQELSVTNKLQRALFLLAGHITPRKDGRTKPLEFTPLAQTNDLTGYTPLKNLITRNPFTGEARAERNPKRIQTGDVYTLAAWIHGPVDTTKVMTAQPGIPAATERGRKQDDLNVILVSDIDVMSTAIFQTRDAGFGPDDDVKLDLDNVTFVLNTLDHLSGDLRFIDVRNRRPKHRTLESIESFVRERQNATLEEKQKFKQALDDSLEATRKTMEAEEAKVEKSIADPIAREQEKNRLAQQNMLRLQKETEKQQEQAERQIENIERDEQLKIRELQAMYKLLAISLPPIPPLILGLVVFMWRRAREREGVPSKRLK
ncbi:MAG TPA: Gldg family protein, partial [Pirellulales bacterium]